MAILLIRHAKAGSRHDWKGDDRLRPLSDAGHRQARGLVHGLEPYPLDQVLSSPFVRCVQTVEPLAEARGLEVEETDGLAEGRTPMALALVRSLVGHNSALCTHGDVVPEVLWSLRGDGLRLPADPRWPKGATWVLHDDGTRFVEAAFVPPPA